MPATPRFDDPELQRILDLLTAGTPVPRASVPDAAEIARHEGLNLPEVAGLGRRRPRHHTRSEAAGHRPARRTLENLAAELIRENMPRASASRIARKAHAWATLGLWPHEMRAWMTAMGVDGAALAQQCLRRGITLATLQQPINGMSFGRRLRGGEGLDALLAQI